MLRLLSRKYDVRLLAFDRTGAGGTSRDPSARRLAISALSEFAAVSVASVPQDTSRSRFAWDHLRSLMTGRHFTHYRHGDVRYGEWVDEALATGDFDVIHVDSLDLARFLPALPLDRVILTHHNVESQLLEDRARRERFPPLRAYVLRQARLQRAAEAYWSPRVRMNLLVSERDAEELRRIAPGAETDTVPNGVDVRAIQSDRTEAEGIICVGGLGWFPNADALDYLCDEILPLLPSEAREQVTWVGRADADQIDAYLARCGVRLTGYVDAVLPLVERAACYVLPFRLGGGTRLKLLEAMAAGRAIVSTTVGAMGVAAENERHMLIADSPAEFAVAVERVLGDDALRRRLGSEARQLAESTYDWEAIGRKMTEIYGRI